MFVWRVLISAGLRGGDSRQADGRRAKNLHIGLPTYTQNATMLCQIIANVDVCTHAEIRANPIIVKFGWNTRNQ